MISLGDPWKLRALTGNRLRQDIRAWLSPPDPSVNFNIASDARHEGTASWFTQSRTFNDWKVSGSLMWVHGKRIFSLFLCLLLLLICLRFYSGLWEERLYVRLPPAYLKQGTVSHYRLFTSSAIIQDVESTSDNGSVHLTYFFFDFKDIGKQDSRALLSSILVQLGDQSNFFNDILLALYSAHHHGSRQPNDRSLAQCLEDMLRVPGEVPIYVIIDALDECPNTTGMPSPRDKALTLVENLVNLSLPNLRLCITSRPEIDIRTSLEPLTCNRISLHDESGQREDIVNFVSSVVYSDKNMRRWRDEDKVLVIKTLADKADGM